MVSQTAPFAHLLACPLRFSAILFPLVVTMHYKPFEEVYGTNTTEKHRPSYTEPGKGGHGIPFSPNVQTARKLIMCTECLKPRVLYAQRKLTHHDEAVLDRVSENYLYSCGSTSAGLECEIENDHPSVRDLFNRVYMYERTLSVTQLLILSPTILPRCLSLALYVHTCCEWTESESSFF